MKNLKQLSVMLIMTSAVLMACQKENQPEIEVGSTVVSGPGPNEYTQKGPNGSVIYSNWIPKAQTDWTGFGTNEITTDINAPSLSESIMNSGAVLVYIDFDGNVRPLPYVWNDENYSLTTAYSFVKEKINVTTRFIGTTISGISDIRFRYILIPGTTQALGGRMNAPVDYNNYNAVCDYYGIPK